MVKKRKTTQGFAIKGKRKQKCEFGVNKNTGECLKYPRRKKTKK